MNKKKSFSKKKALLIALPLVLLAIIIVVAISVNKSNNEKGVFSLIEKRWIDLYRDKKVVDGLSAVKCVTDEDEWLAEAYMKTDYSKLAENDFQKTINDYLSYLVKTGKVYEDN